MLTVESETRVKRPLPIASAPSVELTQDEAAFAAEYARTGNATAALKTVCDTRGRNPVAVRMEASRLTRHPGVVARVAELRSVAAAALNTSVAELALSAHELATASVDDLAPVEVYGCRHCHGIGGAYQWRDAVELCQALDAALRSKGSEPRPSAAGGFGYSSRAPVNSSCEACRGHGVAMVRIVPTSELSAGARQLVAGVVLRDDGSVERYLIEDRAKWAHMRNQLIGAYAPFKSESKSFNVNYNLNAPTTAQPPMSAEDALAKLRAIGVLAPDATPDPAVVSEQ